VPTFSSRLMLLTHAFGTRWDAIYGRVARFGQDRPRRPFNLAFFVGSQLLRKIDAL